jgi:hypothetical protein
MADGLTYTGQLAGLRVSEYQGQKRTQLQFVEKKPDGSLGFLEIKVPEGMDASKYRAGEKITVPVEYKLVRDKIYWAVAKESSVAGTSPQRPQV